MTLREQFEKEHYKRPVEPFSDSENPEQWCHVLKWTEDYNEWLESKVASDNNIYTTKGIKRYSLVATKTEKANRLIRTNQKGEYIKYEDIKHLLECSENSD